MLKWLYRAWPFFGGLLSNMDVRLSKSDLAVPSRYADLVNDEVLRG